MTWGQSLAASAIIGGAIVFGAAIHAGITTGSQRAWDEKVWHTGTITYGMADDGTITSHTMTGRATFVTRDYARAMAGFGPERASSTSAVPGRTLPR